jgi:tetratricopeptide (TPR) repeat protein
MGSDTALVNRVAGQLAVRIAASPWNARDLALLANVELARGRTGDARRLVERALAVDPEVDRAHLLLALIALAESRPREAIVELDRQRALTPTMRGVAIRIGQAWQRLGDLRRARTWYRRELDLEPGNREALDSLAVIGRRLGT